MKALEKADMTEQAVGLVEYIDIQTYTQKYNVEYTINNGEHLRLVSAHGLTASLVGNQPLQ